MPEKLTKRNGSKESGPQSPEEFWNSIRDQVRNQLVSLRDSFVNNRMSPEENEEWLGRAFLREQHFTVSVLEGAEMVLAAHPENFVTLFDIDDTMGATFFRNKDTGVTILRPSISRILAYLKSRGGRIGILTNRRKEIVTKQLTDPDHLTSIEDSIDKELIFSSGQLRSDSAHEFIEEYMTKVEGILDAEKIKKREEEPYTDNFGTTGDQQKVHALESAVRELRGSSILVVDDLWYPPYLNNKAGLYGVCIFDKGRFSISPFTFAR